MAVLRIYPEAKLGVGVANSDGFFHDFEFPIQIQQADLERIADEMSNIILEKLPFTQIYLPREMALNTLLQRGQIYKAELLQDTKDEEISFFKTGSEFIDLCRGPHLANTEDLVAFKLTGLSGAYWKGDEQRPQLQRITGVAFRTEEELTNYFERIEILKELDFRKIGRSLDYFVLHGNQLLMTDLGSYVFDEIVDTISQSAESAGWARINIPIMREDYQNRVKLLFEMRNRSYRELPLKWYSTVLQLPRKGVDIADKNLTLAHQVCISAITKETEYELLLRESTNVLLNIFQEFELNYSLKIFSPDTENDFVKVISSHLETKMLSHSQIISRKSKQVKLAVVSVDNYEREWELAELTIEYPAESRYTNREGELVPTVNITVAITVEKLIAYWLENNHGMLPFWLSPRKCVILPISDKFTDYAIKIQTSLASIGITAQIDERAEKLEARIRDAEMKKVPLIVIVGEKEAQNDAMSLRLRGQNEVGMLKLTEISTILDKIK